MGAIQRKLKQDEGLEPDERRAGPRIHTIFRLARVTRDGDAGLWRVCNISNEGVMLLTGLPVAPGERLTIALSDAFTVKAKVVWAKDGRCGATFDRPIECDTLLQRLAAEQRAEGYRALRLDVDARAIAFCEDGMHSVRVFNISRQGVGVAHKGCFSPGIPTKLMFPGGNEHRGVVRWSDEGRAGIFLIDPLPCDQLESVSRI
ncbi:MAG TPA: PilZ domain-containing protein [Allosphingosinicella sp.]|nr:PilZ domain-containing protein [Allosphingosinicella sp.]